MKVKVSPLYTNWTANNHHDLQIAIKIWFDTTWKHIPVSKRLVAGVDTRFAVGYHAG